MCGRFGLAKKKDYLWQKTTEGSIPHRICLKSGEVFAFAGLWDIWKGGGTLIVSCVIITVAANALVASIHERMPAILTPGDQTHWLQGGVCQDLLRPYEAAL